MQERLKDKIIELLKNKDFQAIRELARKDYSVIRALISNTYDKKDVTCWRAIEALGLVSADMPPEGSRRLAQRLMWMMRDESGGNAWSAPEMLGEIVRNNINHLSDIVPIIGSFHDEEIFTGGVLRALVRIAEIRPDIVIPLINIIVHYINDPNPTVRGFAVHALGSLGLSENKDLIKDIANDTALFDFYKDGELSTITVADMALVFFD